MHLFIDWETTGLYLKGQPSDHPGGCSVSAILDDDQGKTWAEFYSLIKVPREVQWEPKAYEANKLTHDLCERYGMPLETVMARLTEMMLMAENFVAFSAFFDGKFVKIGAAQVGGHIGTIARTTYEAKRRLCTMEASARHFVGPDARFLKLKIAYEKAFGSMFEGAHGAHADNHAQRRLFYWLKAQGCADFGDTQVISQGAMTRAAQEENPGPTLSEIESGETRGFKTKPGKPGAIALD